MNFGSTVATGAKSIATKVRDPVFQEDVKAFGGKVAVGTKEVAGKVADKSKEIWVYILFLTDLFIIRQTKMSIFKKLLKSPWQ